MVEDTHKDPQSGVTTSTVSLQSDRREMLHDSYQEESGDRHSPAGADLARQREKTISSTLGELRTRPGVLHMNTGDAVARGVNTGDAVRVFNALGEVHCLAEVADAVREGPVSMAKGLWRRSSFNQSTATALAPATLTDLGGGACFNDARVEVARILEASWEGKPLSIFVPTEKTSCSSAMGRRKSRRDSRTAERRLNIGNRRRRRGRRSTRRVSDRLARPTPSPSATAPCRRSSSDTGPRAAAR